MAICLRNGNSTYSIPLRLYQRINKMKRFSKVLRIIFKYLWIFLLVKFNFYKKPRQKLVKNFFEEAGGTFIKFGQLLSLRVDALPREYSVELLDLLDNVKTFPYEEVEKVFLEQLGAPPHKIFEEFDEKPFASASFGQVHVGKIGNKKVAIKVMRPGIENDVIVDFIFIDILAFFADLFFKIDALPWKEFAQGFKKWTKEELDYRTEAENTDRLFRNKQHPDVVIPKMYYRFSTSKILVQEFIEGIQLSKILREMRDGDIDAAQLLEQGIDITKTPKLVVEELLRQYFYIGYYHADPHPGNIIVMANNKIGFVDFGILGSSIPNQKPFLEMIKAWGNMDPKLVGYHLMNFAGGELRQMVECAFPASFSEEVVDKFMKSLATQLSDSMAGRIANSRVELKDLKKEYTSAAMGLLKEAAAYKIKLPSEMVAFFRAISLIGFMAKTLDNDFTVTREIRKFFEKYDQKEFLNNDSYISYARMDRTTAIERLTDWVSYLAEKDPPLYAVVNKYFARYNIIN